MPSGGFTGKTKPWWQKTRSEDVSRDSECCGSEPLSGSTGSAVSTDDAMLGYDRGCVKNLIQKARLHREIKGLFSSSKPEEGPSLNRHPPPEAPGIPFQHKLFVIEPGLG